MSNVTIQKRGKFYQYKFEIAKVDGKRKFISKSGFKTKTEAEKEGILAYNDYLNTGSSFSVSDISYADFLDYWIENYCYVNLKYHTIEAYQNIIKNHIKPNIGFYRLIPKHIWYSYSAVQTIANCNPQNILHVTGADTFIRKDVFDKFGGFDPNFFMYNEEVELFYRMHQAGLRACVLPYAVMIHLDGASFDGKKRLAFLRRNEYALKSKFYFYRKHRGRRELLIVKILVFISAILHFYTYRTYLLSYLIKIITW